jgi:hypothetical protein
MPNITTTELANSIATIVSAQVLGYLKSNTVLAGLVNRDYENEVAQHGQTVQIPAAGTLVANDKAQNATVTRQNPSDSKVDVVLNNHKEITFMIEDFAKILARPDWVATYMSQSINVMAEAVDAAIAGLYSGFSQTIDATAGLSEVHFRQARRLLNSAKAPMRQRYAVLHEDAESEFLAIDKAINRDYTGAVGGGDAATQGGGMFYGFGVYMDQNIPVVAGTPNQPKNLFFQRNAMTLVSRPLPVTPGQMGVAQVVMVEDNFALRTTLSYNPDYLAGQVTVDTLFGLAELRDNHGVVVSTTEA